MEAKREWTAIAEVACPECGRIHRFAARGIHQEEILMLIEVDGRACRRCGAGLIAPEVTDGG